MKRKITRIRRSISGIGALLAVLLLMGQSKVSMAQVAPVVTSVTPLVGIPGSGTLTIMGVNFNDTISRNVVIFGGVQATVTAATPISLTVTVPIGATYSNVSVMNLTTGLTGYSRDFFLPTFDATPYLPFSRGFRPRADIAVTGTYHANAQTYQAVLGDIDGDGKPDLVVASYDSFIQSRSPIEIYRNIGTGGAVSYAAPVICTASYGVRNVKLADLDGDGKLDIIAACSGSGRISLIRNMSTPGSINMAPNANIFLSSGAFETVVADFDGDGMLDIAAPENQRDSVMIYRNIITTIPTGAFTSNGTLKPYYVAFRTGNGPVSLAAADIDADGKMDLIVCNNTSNSISILKNNSILDSFIFQPAVNIPVGSNPQQLIAANINNDGKPDIIVNSYNTGSVFVLQNQALVGPFTTATYGTPVSYNLGNGAIGIAVGDLDADGKVDIAVSKILGDSFTVLRNNTAGTAGETITGTSFIVDSTYYVGAGYGPLGITIGDVDGDTKADIITGNNFNSTISIFESFEVPEASPISGPDSICIGSTGVYTSSHGAGATGTWTVSNGHAFILGGSGAADTSADVTGITSGADTITYRIIYLSDTTYQTKVVYINALPDTGAIQGPSQVCVNSSIALYDTTASRGFWSSSDTAIAFVDSITGIVTGRTVGNATIMYHVATSSCGTSFASHSVDVRALPNAGTISGAGGTCVGSTITLTASNPGGSWINEYPAIASDFPSMTNDVVTGVSQGTDTILYVSMTASCGNDTTYAVVGVIDGTHSLPITGDTIVCLGIRDTLSNAATGGTWTSNAPLNASVDPVTGVVTGHLAGTAIISYSVTYTCGTVDTFITVHVHALPVVTPIANQSVCNGSIAAVGFVSNMAGSTFAWTNTDTAIGLPASGSSNPIVFTARDTANGGTTGTITVRATANGCTSNPVNFNITVTPTATLTSSKTPPSICDNTTFAYTQTSDRTGTTYRWHRNAVAGIITPAASGTGNISEVLDNTTSDSVKVIYLDTLTYNGCTTTDSITVYVKATPLLSTVTNPPVCDSTLFAYAPISTTGGATYTWTRPVVAGIANPAASGTGGVTEYLDNTTNNPVTVTYHYTVTASGCSSNNQNVTVLVNNSAVLSSGTNAGIICDSSLFTYVPTSATTGATYTWTRDTVTGITNAAAAGTGTINEYLFNTTNSPVFVTYRYVTSINGCSGDTQSVIVAVNPRAYLTSTLNPPYICSESFFNYNPTSNISATWVTFSWTRAGVPGISNLPGSGVGNPNEMLQNTTNAAIDVPYVFTTTYMGCSYMQTVTVRVQPKPLIAGATSDTVCSGTPFSYTPTGVFAGTNFVWTRPAVPGITPDTASGTIAINETLYNSTHAPINAIYVYTVSTSFCSYRQNFTLTVDPTVSPSPSITTHSPANVCENTMFQNFGAAGFTSDTSISYVWTARNATIYATGPSTQYALVNFTTPGTALVVLSANISVTNCLVSDTFVVNVSSAQAPQPAVYYLNNQFVCIPANLDSYQWGYDDGQFDSTMLTGEVNQDYNNPAPDATKSYWVMTTQGDCFQKTYYRIPTGVSNVNADNIAMKLFPNPASDMLTVEVNNDLSGDVEVQVYNMVGQMIGTTQLMNNRATFAVSSYAPGSYLVACYRNGVKVATSRFIKN